MIAARNVAMGSLHVEPLGIDVIETWSAPGDGMIGLSLLDQFRLTLDLERPALIIARSGIAQATEEKKGAAATVPLRYANGALFVRLRVADQRVWANLDTGTPENRVSLRLARTLAKAAPSLDSQASSHDFKVAVGDTARRVHSLYVQRSLPVQLLGSTPPVAFGWDHVLGSSTLDTQISPGFSFEVSVVLGMLFFDQYTRVTIDYARALLTLEEKAKP